MSLKGGATKIDKSIVQGDLVVSPKGNRGYANKELLDQNNMESKLG